MHCNTPIWFLAGEQDQIRLRIDTNSLLRSSVAGWESARDLLISARREARATGPAFPQCKIWALDANTWARKKTGGTRELGPQLLLQQPRSLICAESEVTEDKMNQKSTKPPTQGSEK